MSVFAVETYVIRAEKIADFTPALNEFIKYKETHSELFEGLKSWKLFKQERGGLPDLYIEMWEYDSLAEMERISDRIFSDEGMKRISQGFHQLVEPESFSNSVWYPVA